MCRWIDWAPAFAGVTKRVGVPILLALVFPAQAGTQYPGIGRAATADEIAAWDIDVRADFKGLPPGSGSVAKGLEVWEGKCASCHGTFAEANDVFPPLIGGTTAEDIRTGRAKALATGGQARTTIMKLANISTLWDFIRRAMPWNAPKTLTPDEVYAVVAYLLNLADIVPENFTLSDRNMAEVQARLPNRNGLTVDHGLRELRGKPDVRNVACMRNCPVHGHVASALPEYAQDAHGNLAQQNRLVGATRGKGDATAAVAMPMPPAELARRKGCLACHSLEKAIVGPAFRDVAARYRGQADAPARLAAKVRKGGSGTWGAMAMPPHPDLAENDLASLVRWVLSAGI
jgi:S-disulfanyl-L-cysteine oxidoreductase SoxD